MHGFAKARDLQLFTGLSFTYRVNDEQFGYNMAGNMTSYQVTEAISSDTCVYFDPSAKVTRWEYKYTPFGEREQKRMVKSPEETMAGTGGLVYPWQYTSLGLGNKNSAVYHCSEIKYVSSIAFSDGTNGGNPFGIFSGNLGMFYPTEYNVFGSGMAPAFKYKYVSENGIDVVHGWKRYYYVYDHLGNVRKVLTPTTWLRQFAPPPAPFIALPGVYEYASFDYLPFGDTLHVNTPENTKTSRERSGFIGKEKDAESGLGDFGVRKYDFLAGRFTSPDAMWEKYVGLTPYQYAGNNPVGAVDLTGKDIIVLIDKQGAQFIPGVPMGHAAVLIGNDKTGWELYSKNGTENHGAFGPSANPQLGKYTEENGPKSVFPTLKDFLKDQGELQTRFEKGFRIEASKDDDDKAKSVAKQAAESYYDVLNANCVDVVSEALESIGLFGGTKTSNTSYRYGEKFEAKDLYITPIPNVRYDQIKENNLGTEIDLDLQREIIDATGSK